MQEIIHAVKMSGGLMILMAVVLLIALAVIIERLYVLKKVLAQGKDLHNKLRQVPYQNSPPCRPWPMPRRTRCRAI